MSLTQLLRLALLCAPLVLGGYASATEMQVVLNSQGSGTLNGVAFSGGYTFTSTYNTDNIALIGGTPKIPVVQADSSTFWLANGSVTPVNLAVPVWFETEQGTYMNAPIGDFQFGGGDVRWLEGNGTQTGPYYGSFFQLLGADSDLGGINLLNQTAVSYSGLIGGQGDYLGVIPYQIHPDAPSTDIQTVDGILSLTYPTPIGSEWTLSITPYNASAVPEPVTGTLAAGGLALIGLGIYKRKAFSQA
jgi:hypothetical protein